MEQTKVINNSFISPVIENPIFRDLSDDVVHVYELHEFVEKGPSGDPEDFVVVKKPIEVDCYHLTKELQQRAAGCDLKSIIARIKESGDASLLQQREVIYGDGTKTPSNLSDAMEEGRKTSDYLDSLSDEDKRDLINLSKMSDEEFTSYIKGLAEKRSKSKEVVKEEGEK